MSLIHYYAKQMIYEWAVSLATILTTELCSKEYLGDEEMPIGDDELWHKDGDIYECAYDYYIMKEFFLPLCEELVQEW